jgi:hypothetical protein
LRSMARSDIPARASRRTTAYSSTFNLAGIGLLPRGDRYAHNGHTGDVEIHQHQDHNPTNARCCCHRRSD